MAEKESVAYIDNDGVLFEYRKGMIKRIAMALGKPLTKSFLEHFYETTLAMDDSEVLHAFSHADANLHHLLNVEGPESFAADVEVYEKVRDGLALLKKYKFRTYIVTARTERMREATVDTFKRHDLLGFIDGVFMRLGKDIPPELFKGEIAAELGTTHAFEDTFANLESVRKSCPALEKAYLINRPWNAKYVSDKLYQTRKVSIERMDSFYDAVVDAVATLKK